MTVAVLVLMSLAVMVTVLGHLARAEWQRRLAIAVLGVILGLTLALAFAGGTWEALLS